MENSKVIHISTLAVDNSRVEIKSIERRFNVLITPPLANLERNFIKVQDKLDWDKKGAN